jgi:hypothetical protein
MHATFILEFGDLADVIAGNPKTEAPPASRERWRKRRRVTGGMFIVRGSKWLTNQILRPEFMMQLFYIGNIREAAGDRHFLSMLSLAPTQQPAPRLLAPKISTKQKTPKVFLRPVRWPFQRTNQIR